MIFSNYLDQENNEVTHGSSFLGHVVINCNREAIDHNLIMDYLADNS